MATAQRDETNIHQYPVPGASEFSFVILVAEWNSVITEALYDGAFTTLIRHGARPENIIRRTVPGAFELVSAGAMVADQLKPDAVICIGCVIQGDTKHFDFICDSVANGLQSLNITYKIPFIFGVLTPNTFEQAHERAGGKLGNKGDEAAEAAIKMASLKAGLGELK